VFNLILFGPPGAGKGTQSKNIITKYGFDHISTGDILRREIEKYTTLGKIVKDYIDKGQLVPDHVLIDILKSTFIHHPNATGFVWDGFPRTTVQAAALDRMLSEEGYAVSLVIALQVEQDELMRRVIQRAHQEGRSDDKEDIIQQRFRIYRDTTMPIIEYYTAQKKFESIPGMDPVDVVFKNICSRIEQYMK
jgi:adenylate kinase